MSKSVLSLIDSRMYMGKVLESCFKENHRKIDGQNECHSRTMILGDYRSPKHGNLSIEEETLININSTTEVLKHFAKKYLVDLKIHGYDLSKPLSYYFPEICNKELTGNDLLTIHNMSTKELVEFIRNKDNKDNNMYKLLYNFFRCGDSNNSLELFGISDEHFSTVPLYWDNTCEEGEVLFTYGHSGYSKRIYMNLPKKSEISYRFGVEFCKKCIDRGIPFDMKLFGTCDSREINSVLDNTIIYSKNKFFSDHISIVEEILYEHPEFKRYIGDPIYTGGRVTEDDGKCYYAVSSSGKGGTFNTQTDCIINMAYLQTCMDTIKAYAAYFYHRLDSDTIHMLSKISSMPRDINYIDALGKMPKDTVREIRSQVKKFIDYKKNSAEYKEVIGKMVDRMYDNYKDVKSLVKYGDTNHRDVPLYRDKNFDLFLESVKKKKCK